MAGSLSAMARDDTLLGACYAVGEDFGFNPLWLRILFAFGVLSSPAISLTAYAALTAIVVLSRWMVPDPACAAEVRPGLRFKEEEVFGLQEELRLAA
jgi:phage shock protein PspC (stress-responsive transcriptional regulator)